MWCAAGELVKTHSVRQEEYESTDALTNHISAEKLTCPEIWLSDLVDPVPLQRHRWESPERNMGEWLADIDDDAFLRELFPEDRSGWVVVGARIECKYEDRLEEVEIYSGLVSPGTAHALVRALQTTAHRHDFLIPPQDHDLEIDQSDYSLIGWLMNLQWWASFRSKGPFSTWGRSTPGFAWKGNCSKFATATTSNQSKATVVSQGLRVSVDGVRSLGRSLLRGRAILSADAGSGLHRAQNDRQEARPC